MTSRMKTQCLLLVGIVLWCNEVAEKVRLTLRDDGVAAPRTSARARTCTDQSRRHDSELRPVGPLLCCNQGILGPAHSLPFHSRPPFFDSPSNKLFKRFPSSGCRSALLHVESARSATPTCLAAAILRLRVELLEHKGILSIA